MPIQVTKGILDFLAGAGQVNAAIWEGEVPRYDVNGNPITPDAAVSPPTWPAIKATIEEPGFKRTWTTEDPYSEEGRVLLQVYGVTKPSVQAVADKIEAALAQASNWQSNVIVLGGPQTNPNYVIQALLDTWWIGQEEGVRLQNSQLCYRADLHYEVMLHGIISTA